MSWADLFSGPAGTLSGSVAGALLAQLSYWFVVHRRARAQLAAEAAQLALARLSNDESANERLFRNIDDRLRWCEQRYADCEKMKRELEAGVIFLEGTVMRLSAALDIMRTGYAAAGLKEPPLPHLHPPTEVPRPAPVRLTAPREEGFGPGGG
jgi:hypothetical protein